jgi:hypothetical protein
VVDYDAVNFRAIQQAFDKSTAGVPVTTLLAWRREGRAEDVRAIKVAEHLAQLLFKLYEAELGKHFHYLAVAFNVKKHLRQWVKLHNFIHENELPPVLYLRSQVAIFKSQVFVNALRTSRALRRFEVYCDKEAGKLYLPQDVWKRLEKLNQLGDPVKELVEEFREGRAYLNSAIAMSPGLSREAVMFLECSALPGAFCLMEPFLADLFEQGGLDQKTTQRMQAAAVKLAKPTVGNAFLDTLFRRGLL